MLRTSMVLFISLRQTILSKSHFPLAKTALLTLDRMLHREALCGYTGN